MHSLGFVKCYSGPPLQSISRPRGLLGRHCAARAFGL